MGMLVPAWGGGGQKQSNDPRNNQHNPQYANYWAPLTRKRWPEAPWGGGGSWRPGTRRVAPPVRGMMRKNGTWPPKERFHASLRGSCFMKQAAGGGGRAVCCITPLSTAGAQDKGSC